MIMHMQDQVLLKSDSFPTYHLAAVCPVFLLPADSTSSAVGCVVSLLLPLCG